MATTVLITVGVTLGIDAVTPSNAAAWAITVLSVLLLSSFFKAFALQSQIDKLGGVSWVVSAATVELRPVLHGNSGTTENNVIAQVDLEIRNGSDRAQRVCPPQLTLLRRRGRLRWRPVELATARISHGDGVGSHQGDYSLPERARLFACTHLMGTTAPDLFLELTDAEVSAELLLDVIGHEVRRCRIPLQRVDRRTTRPSESVELPRGSSRT